MTFREIDLERLALHAMSADDFAALANCAPGAPLGMFLRCAFFLASIAALAWLGA